MLLLHRVLDEKMNLLVLVPNDSSLSASLKSVNHLYREKGEVKMESILNRLLRDKPEVLSAIGDVRSDIPKYQSGIIDLMCYLQGALDVGLLTKHVVDDGCLVVMPNINEGDGKYFVFVVDKTIVERGIRITSLPELILDNPESYYFVSKDVKAKLDTLASETKGDEA